MARKKLTRFVLMCSSLELISDNMYVCIMPIAVDGDKNHLERVRNLLFENVRTKDYEQLKNYVKNRFFYTKRIDQDICHPSYSNDKPLTMLSKTEKLSKFLYEFFTNIVEPDETLARKVYDKCIYITEVDFWESSKIVSDKGE